MRALWGVAFGLLAVALPSIAGGPPDPVLEHRVKAAFVYHFAQLTRWPEDAFRGPDDPIRLGLAGAGPAEAPLLALAGKLVHGRPLQVARWPGPGDPGPWHVLFVGRDAGTGPETALGSVPDGVLTVGDVEGFARRGGHIEITVRDGRVRFLVNRGAARGAGLRLSSRLLALALEVLP